MIRTGSLWERKLYYNFRCTLHFRARLSEIILEKKSIEKKNLAVILKQQAFE